MALAGDTDDSWMKSQLVADASEQGLHLQHAMCHHMSKVAAWFSESQYRNFKVTMLLI